MKKNYITHLSFRSFFFLVFLGLAFSAKATIYPFHNTYSGAQEAPPNASTATGTIVGTYNDVTNTISYTIIFAGLSANTTAAHFHGPAPIGVSAGVAIAHAGFPAGVKSGTYTASNVLTNAQEAQLLAGLWYSNIHTAGPLAGGEIRAQIIMGDPAATSIFVNRYSGAQEAPPNASPATGTIVGSYNHATNTISYSIIFSGLTANTTAAHFHGPAPVGVSAGVVIPHAGFPVGVTAGFYSNSHVLNNVHEMQLLGGLWYSNIHTVGPLAGGEIRAQILLQDILPPAISDPVASPNTLWPPNHKMRDVTISYTSTDNFPGAVNCQLSVSSNEPVTGVGDNTSPDWVIISNNKLQLRAERTGRGSGRVYTITVTCTDAQGNSSSKSTTVTVPHDQSKSEAPGGSVMETTGQGLLFSVSPNPSTSQFTVNIQTGNAEKINVRVLDLVGRVVESRNNLAGSQTIKLGNNLQAGIYFIQLIQGSTVKQLKVVKVE